MWNVNSVLLGGLGKDPDLPAAGKGSFGENTFIDILGIKCTIQLFMVDFNWERVCELLT